MTHPRRSHRWCPPSTAVCAVVVLLLSGCANRQRAAGDAATQAGPGGSGQSAGAGAPSTGGASGTGGSSGSVTDTSGGAGGARACTDTTSDPLHCGRCGNVCGQVALASDSNPRAIVMNGGTLYWLSDASSAEESTLMKLSVAGGPPVPLAAGKFQRIVVDAKNVYLTTGDAVVKIPTSGGPMTILAANQGYAYNLAIDATSVYWTVSTTDSCPPDGDACADGVVRKVPIAGGPLTTLASGQARPEGLTVDGRNVYWINTSYNIFTGAVMKAPLAGGIPTTLAAAQNGVTGAIAVAGNNVYWTGFSVGNNTSALTRVSIEGGIPTPVVTTGSLGYDVVVGGGSLFLLETDTIGSNVKAVPVDGGAPSIIGRVGNASSIAVDAANVYWADSVNDGVWAFGAKTCERSQCQCPPNQTACFGSCIDLATDPMNCAACGVRCPQGSACRDGRCAQ